MQSVLPEPQKIIVTGGDSSAFVNAMADIRSQTSTFKALGSKKFVMAYTLVGMNFYVAWQAVEQNALYGGIFFGIGTLAGIAYLFAQARVDAAQMQALGVHSTSSDFASNLKKVEE